MSLDNSTEAAVYQSFRKFVYILRFSFEKTLKTNHDNLDSLVIDTVIFTSDFRKPSLNSNKSLKKNQKQSP